MKSHESKQTFYLWISNPAAVVKHGKQPSYYVSDHSGMGKAPDPWVLIGEKEAVISFNFQEPSVDEIRAALISNFEGGIQEIRAKAQLAENMIRSQISNLLALEAPEVVGDIDSTDDITS